MNYLPSEKTEILKKLGDLGGLELFHEQVLVATLIRPEKTTGGIILTDSARFEDTFQSKIGLIVKTGPNAFVTNEGTWWRDCGAKVGDWVIVRPSDGWAMMIRGTPCRMVSDTSIRGKIIDQSAIW